MEFETIIDFCGSGDPGKQDGPRKSAKFNMPSAIAFDPHINTLYVCDEGNNCVRTISHSGVVSTLHLKWNDSLKKPCGVCIGNDNILYISDTGNHRIISVDRLGHVTVIAANKKKMDNGSSADALIDAKLKYPLGLSYSHEENLLFVCDSLNHQVLQLDLNNRTCGEILKIQRSWYRQDNALNPKPCCIVVKDSKHMAFTREYIGDVAVCSEAKDKKHNMKLNWQMFGGYEPQVGAHDDLNFNHDWYRPFGICDDLRGHFYVSQPLRQCIRRIDSMENKKVSVIIAPKSKKVTQAMIFSDDLVSPYGIACDSVGNLMICDKYANKIKKLVRRGYASWSIVRLLWLGKMKKQSQKCFWGKLPREVIFQIIRFLDKWSIEQYDTK